MSRLLESMPRSFGGMHKMHGGMSRSFGDIQNNAGERQKFHGGMKNNDGGLLLLPKEIPHLKRSIIPLLRGVRLQPWGV